MMSISHRGLTKLYVKAVSTELAVSHVDYFHPGGRSGVGGCPRRCSVTWI